MAGCCGKRNRKNRRVASRNATATRDRYDVMGGYKYLQPHQVRARLEVYKKKFCQSCEKRYDCDYKMYQECKKYRIDGGR